MLVAHTPGPDGAWHLLEDHLHAVAEQAAAAAERFAGAELAHWAGLLHDAGKASPAFQHYLHDCAAEPGRKHKSVDHKSAGALMADPFGLLLELLILGHHGGLPDSELKEHKIRLAKRDKDVQKAITRVHELGIIPDLLSACASLSLPGWVLNAHGRADPLELEFFLRLLFSALVDADHSDTERHFQPTEAARRTEPLPSIASLVQRLRDNQSSLAAAGQRAAQTAQARQLQCIRDDVYTACLAASAEPAGFFRLTVPTGGGKTRSSLAFALEHAVRHGLERVIVAVPYLTITDQTADVFRSIFPDERAVLEHHSGVAARQQRAGDGRQRGRDAEQSDDDGGQSANEIWRRLATQDWNAPIVVTTTVQLFESLFGNSPSSCRKLHRLARSVIVLDEAQTLPLGLLSPILSGLRSLVAHYGSSVVLCTATQPALDDAPGFQGLPDVREIVPDPPALYRALTRVTYAWPEPGAERSWDEISRELRGAGQVLAIVNTRADALALFAALDDPDAIHLSTLLCPAHRRELLHVIRARLRRGRPVRLVSTQVVEAGVDLDFPLVYRAVGPLDSIVQAAGRCNREGRLPEGRMVVFNPLGRHIPQGAYRIGTDLTESLLSEGQPDLHDPHTFLNYFQQLYLIGQDLDEKGIQKLRKSRNYPKVAHDFRMIDETIPVIVPYTGLNEPFRSELENPNFSHAEALDEMVNALVASKPGGVGESPSSLLAKLQPYVINLRESEFRVHFDEGRIGSVRERVFKWERGYDERGISMSLPVDDLLW